MKLPGIIKWPPTLKWVARIDFIKLVYYMEKLEFYTIRYPCNSLKYITDVVGNQSQVPLGELTRYKQFLPDTRRFGALIVIIVYLLLCAKYLFYIFFTLTSIDFYDIDKNLNRRPEADNTSGKILYEFACLRTNCSRLSVQASTSSSLSNDLVDFPIFSICYPALRWFYLPQFVPQSLTVFLTSELVVFVFIMCVMIPIYQCINPPTTNKPFFFAICPQTELNLARDQIRLLSIDIFSSFANYQVSVKQQHQQPLRDQSMFNDKSSSFNKRRQASSQKGDQKFTRQQQKQRLQTLNPNKSFIGQMDEDSIKNLGLDRHSNSTFVGDCLPLIRTNWWRHKWARGLVINYCLSLGSFMVIFCFAGLLLVHFQMTSYYEQSASKLSFAQENNCSIWFHKDEGKIMEILTLDEHIKLEWNYYTIGEFAFAAALPLYIVTLTICNYYLVCSDELMWIKELRQQLKLAIEFGHLIKHKDMKVSIINEARKLMKQNGDNVLDQLISARQHGAVAANSTGPEDGNICGPREEKLSDEFMDYHRHQNHHHPIDQNFQMSLVKEKLIRTIEFDGILVYEKRRDGMLVSDRSRSKRTLERRLADQGFALQLIGVFGLKASVYEELLLKIQINYWHFMLYMKHNDRGITNVLNFAGFLNYGFSVVAFYYNRNFRDLSLFPILVILLVLVTTCFFISIASNIHSQCSKLEPLIWQLLALNVDSNNQQVEHMRRLWLKELIAMDEVGGLSHKFHRINITYIGIIEMLIWTSTLLLLSLTRI